MMALGLVSCSAADDDLTGDTTTRVNTVAQTTSLVFLLIVIDYADEQFRRTVL